MKKIHVIKPFTFYENGYKRCDFQIGEYDASLECAAYAEKAGYVKKEVKTNGRTRCNTGGSETTLQN